VRRSLPPEFRHGAASDHGTLEFEGQGHGIASALIRDVLTERPSRIERFYWRAVWFVGARCLRLWLRADATDSPLRS
jgi:hypothetical protein